MFVDGDRQEEREIKDHDSYENFDEKEMDYGRREYRFLLVQGPRLATRHRDQRSTLRHPQ